MWKNLGLWLVALLMAAAAMIYQRSTGPTYPYKGHLTHDGQAFKYKLIRTHETTAGAVVELPNIDGADMSASLNYKRYQTDDAIKRVAFKSNGTTLTAALPIQPAAGKMSYTVSGSIDGVPFQIPDKSDERIILRYKDPVPDAILIPHVIMMILVIIFGMRAGLSALFQPGPMRKLTFVAFLAMSIGGMMLGPIVQKYAFGEYWTGFPFGGDFTDNKMLIMWVVWALAVAIIGFKAKKKEGLSRAAVIGAALIMTVVYLIPHSMGGSTLDYDQVDEGIDPKEAIRTGAE